MAGTYYKVCVACVSIFYAIRVEDLAAERVAAEASIIDFVEAQRAEGLLAPFLVVQDFIVDRLQIIAKRGPAAGEDGGAHGVGGEQGPGVDN